MSDVAAHTTPASSLSAALPRTHKRGCTKEQAFVIHKYAERGEVAAVSVGLGSNGHPAGPDGWLLLISGQSLWIEPDGTERPA